MTISAGPRATTDAREVQRCRDVHSLLEAQSRLRPTATAIEAPDGSKIDYRGLFERVVALACGLRRWGARRQSRFAIVLPNGPDMAVTLLGVTCCSVAAPLNPAYTRQEYEDCLRRLRVDGVLLQAGVDSAAREAARSLKIPLLELSLDFPEGPRLADEGGGRLPDPAGPGDVALALLTSGSTGTPKRVPLTHANICASIPEVCASIDLRPEDRCLSMWEQFHIGGLVDLLMAPLSVGSTVICGPRFDAATFFRLLDETRPTWFQAVPATLHDVLAHARRQGVQRVDSSLRLIRSVAAALPPAVRAEAEALFGVPVLQTFGMTEASPLITSTALPPAVRKPGSVGRSFGTRVAIMDDAGNMLPAGQVGEVVVQGPNIMSGYEDDPEANQAAFRHGWFHTGDLGCLDPEGDLFLKGRVREMINRGGEKICPQEIDDLLAGHPAVAQAAAFPIPHRVLGEDCALAVVLRRPGSLGVEEIRDYLAARLSAYKIPHLIQIVDTLPRGPTGKVSRRLLSEGSSLAREAPYAPPRSELECRLADIWAAELQVARVGLDDNFFLLGGDSLSGVRLLATVEQELGRALPVRALLNLATIRSMAEALGVEDAVPDVPAGGPASGRGLPESGRRKLLRVLGSTGIPLVSPNHAVLSLHAAGSRPPLYWCFNSPEKEMRQLGGQLGADQPLYGLYSGGNLFDYTDEIHDQFAAMYVDELLELLPQGPFYLGGNCRGASVAGCMAVRLVERGRTPEALCLMEDFAPILYEYPGRMLLLYGRQSKLRAQRRFRWGWPGWRASFRREPEVDWLTGGHARFFESGNIGVLGSRLELFFRGATPRRDASRRMADALLRAVHEFYPLFLLYLTLGRWRTNAAGGRDSRVL